MPNKVGLIKKGVCQINRTFVPNKATRNRYTISTVEVPCDIVEMKAFVKQRLYVNFSNVMLGFERASLLDDSALMSSADKHLSLYVRLCEWAGSDKSIKHHI